MFSRGLRLVIGEASVRGGVAGAVDVTPWGTGGTEVVGVLEEGRKSKDWYKVDFGGMRCWTVGFEMREIV